MRKIIVFLCIVSFMLVGIRSISAAPPRVPNNNDSPLGTNFHFFADWSSEYVFINAFRSARPWITSNGETWDTKESSQLQLDANGYPTWLPSESDQNNLYRHVVTLMFNDVRDYPSGEYKVLYDGEGRISYGRDAHLVHSQSGQDILNVEANNGILLRIEETTPGNHIRNIRVIMPDYTVEEEQTQVYHDDFLDAIDQFRVLRFMDWMRTNWDHDGPIDRSANNGLWGTRSLPTDAFYTTGRGMPIERMVELSNIVHADPWFTHSHLETDYDMQQFAQLVLSTLDSDRDVYIEYSNEVWNYSFTQGTWIEQMAQLDPSISGDAEKGLQKRLSWYGKRSTEMCDIWKQAWGAESDRVICTIATQAANPWVGEQMLDCPLWSGGPCYDKIDAVAIAPYFGQHIGNPKYVNEVKLWTNDADGGLNKLFQELEFGNVLTDKSDEYLFKTTVTNAIGYAAEYKTMADARGIDVVSYEGGQHLAGTGGAQNEQDIHYLLMEANKDPRMTALYETYLAGWNETGAKFFLHYVNSGVYNKYGYWGAKEFLTEPETPKQAAIETHIVSTPCDYCNGGVPTAITLETQSTVAKWSNLWLLIPFGLLAMVTLRRRHMGLLLALFLFVGCQPSLVEPTAAEMSDPAILNFVADATSWLPGQPVLLTWATEGVSSMQLRTMTFDASSGGVSEETVNANGTLLITPAIGQPAGNIVFELIDEVSGISSSVELENACTDIWVFLPAPSQCGGLPTVHTDARMLPFEHGYMIYISSLKAVWVMTTDGSRTWDLRATYDPANDMLEDPNINPPLLSNFYEPAGAMGKVWRETPDVRDTLGWATVGAAGVAIPIPYVAMIQCTTFSRNGFCLMNSAPAIGFTFQFSRDPIWELDFNGILAP